MIGRPTGSGKVLECRDALRESEERRRIHLEATRSHSVDVKDNSSIPSGGNPQSWHKDGVERKTYPHGSHTESKHQQT